MAQTSIQDLIRWAAKTPGDPRGGLRKFLSLNWPPILLVQAILGITIVGVIISNVVIYLMPPLPDDQQIVTLNAGPIVSFMIQAVVTLVIIFLAHGAAKLFGGTGSVKDTIGAVLWLQFILLFVQIAQAVLMLTVPSVGVLVFMLSFGLLFYLLVNFISEIHGFQNTGLVFLTTLGVLFAASMVLATILVSVGYVPALEAADV